MVAARTEADLRAAAAAEALRAELEAAAAEQLRAAEAEAAAKAEAQAQEANEEHEAKLEVSLASLKGIGPGSTVTTSRRLQHNIVPEPCP